MEAEPGIQLGLNAIGLHDKDYLHRTLLSCDDPLKAISDFQDDNSILLPTLKPALNILDLHSVKRLDFHVSIADELKDHLIKRIEDMTNSSTSITSSSSSSFTSNSSHQNSTTISKKDLKKLEDLLDKSYPLILMPRLTPLVLLLLDRLPKVKPVYLNHIRNNQNLYNMVSLRVKRQIWGIHTGNIYLY
jgi:negative elongation factor B